MRVFLDTNVLVSAFATRGLSADVFRLVLAEHEPDKPLPVPIRDHDDRWVLASAVAGRADVLLTGDKDLLQAAPPGPLRILDPRGFWELSRRSR